MQPPFKPGVLSTIQARAKVEVETNGSLSSITLTYPGANYISRPGCFRRSTPFRVLAQ